MREYAVVYNRRTDAWSVIQKDFMDKEWSVYQDDLSEEVARVLLKGLEAE